MPGSFLIVYFYSFPSLSSYWFIVFFMFNFNNSLNYFKFLNEQALTDFCLKSEIFILRYFRYIFVFLKIVFKNIINSSNYKKYNFSKFQILKKYFTFPIKSKSKQPTTIATMIMLIILLTFKHCCQFIVPRMHILPCIRNCSSPLLQKWVSYF